VRAGAHPTIRPFEEIDVDFAYEMTVREQWNVTRADIKHMFNYEPTGCFIAEVKGSRVAHVFTVNYGSLGWIGLLIVEAEYRKKGIATLLMKKATDYLLHSGVKTIKLEAVPEIADLYRKLGFVDEYYSLRFMGKSRKTIPLRSDSANCIQKEKIKEVAKFDAAYFGAYRTAVLASLFQENPNLCFASYKGSKIVGYLMCREAERGYNVGPFVCDPEESQTARDLLGRCMRELGSETSVYLGVPAVNEGAIEILRDFGFEQYSKSMRMQFGKNLGNERPRGVFAIGGAMKG
jgi:ribosomal protein S18 acetylase RimI-like enzyme